MITIILKMKRDERNKKTNITKVKVVHYEGYDHRRFIEIVMVREGNF